MDASKIECSDMIYQSMQETSDRLKRLDNDPKGLVQAYVANRYSDAQLSSQRFLTEYLTKWHLLQLSPEERFKGFYWLLNKKYSSVDNENFEYAAAVRDSLSDLEDVLLPYKKSEAYRAMVDFIKAEQGLEKLEIESKYEQFLMSVFDANIAASGKMELDFMDVQIMILPIHFIENTFRKTSQFIDYLENRDETTKSIQKIFSKQV